MNVQYYFKRKKEYVLSHLYDNVISKGNLQYTEGEYKLASDIYYHCRADESIDKMAARESKMLGQEKIFFQHIIKICRFIENTLIEDLYINCAKYNIPKSYVKFILPILPLDEERISYYLENYDYSEYAEEDLVKQISVLFIFLYKQKPVGAPNKEYIRGILDRIKDNITKNRHIKNAYKLLISIYNILRTTKNDIRIVTNIPLDESLTNVVKNGCFFMPWKTVKFINGYIYLYHPFTPNINGFRVHSKHSISAFNQIPTYFINKLPYLYVKSEDSKIVDVYNISDIDLGIEKLIDKNNRNNGIKTQKVTHNLAKMNDLELREHLKQSKSKYLNWLCQQQLSNYKIYYVREIKTNSDLIDNDEDAFIFTIKETSLNVTLVYENSNEDRSTIVFRVPKFYVKERINQIHQYFSSTLVNKRELLAEGKADDSIFQYNPYERILHTTFVQWSNTIKRFSNNLPIHNYYEW